MDYVGDEGGECRKRGFDKSGRKRVKLGGGSFGILDYCGDLTNRRKVKGGEQVCWRGEEWKWGVWVGGGGELLMDELNFIVEEGCQSIAEIRRVEMRWK